ncbi:DMT family transporter [Candidatus Bathyarchaeota archaeon]|nr:DMT family transporter [Candidatus Bathyarchaeota archaeon]
MDTRSTSRLNVFLMLLLISFWGSSFVVVKVALNEGLSPTAIATFRFLIAGALFMAAIMIKKSVSRKYCLSIQPRELPTILLLSLTGVTVFFIAQYTGIRMAGASIAAIFVCLLAPIIISALSVRLLKEKLRRTQIVGIAIAAIGTFIVIVGGGWSAQGGTDFLLGSILLLLTPFLWATYSLLGRRTLEKYDAFLVVAYVNMLGGLFLVPFSVAENSFHMVLGISSIGWVSILFLSVTCSFFGYLIWFHVLKQAGAAATSSFLFIEPVITVIFAVTLFGERVDTSVLGGAFLIFVGVYLVTRR